MIYGVDCASYQGLPDWARVKRSGISFAFSKVTQGTGYVNPTWSHNRAGMLALGSGFVPGAYHFLEAGTAADGVAQARHFFANLGGNANALAVGLDVEPDGQSKPGASVARAWVAEFKRLTNNHPVIGYFPGWWWQQIGSPDLGFFDTLWQSKYVSGGGTVPGLYGHVPSSWWAAYGGEAVSVLQHTSTATVPGISGVVDGNAYRGTVAELRALALGSKPTPSPTPTPVEDDMLGQLATGKDAVTPISWPKGKCHAIGFFADTGLVAADPVKLRVAYEHAPGKFTVSHVVVDSAKGKTVVSFGKDAPTVDAVSVRREDEGLVPVSWDAS